MNAQSGSAGEMSRIQWQRVVVEMWRNCSTLKNKVQKLFDSLRFLLTYGAGEFARALLQQPDYLSLLSRGASAANHSGTLTRKLHELILVVLQTDLQVKPPEWTGEQLRPQRIHVTDLSCGSSTAQLKLQFNFFWGLESDSNHKDHFQRCFSGCDIIMHHTDTSDFIRGDKSVRLADALRIYLKRVTRYHQCTVVFSPESVELQVGFPSCCHL